MTKTAAAIAAAFVALSPVVGAITAASPVSASPTCDWSQPYDQLQKCLHQQQGTAPQPVTFGHEKSAIERGFDTLMGMGAPFGFFIVALISWGVSDWFKKHGKNDEDESDTAAPTTYHVHINTRPDFEHQAPPVYTQPVDLSGAQPESDTDAEPTPTGVDPAYADELRPQTPNGNPFESLF
ncbi:hypothetical protein KIH27_15930 [Mycobacterium sp. M1]|uniref:Uncharacterized protein n=1 Tax=Mycolicibacter acidiphilus TaxID=2835306 RepID=A0ABS5RM46_9MYCO|nr:hypothetical protein [Mycolicibacter acidiphilus]MBS9535077.1 hypothetical protein [Mycolicibacter acidiphilus]